MKFKVGDLVTLSAAGRKMQQNRPVLDGFGMVVEVMRSRLPGVSDNFPIKCQWYGKHKSSMRFKEYELKFFKGEQ